MGKKKKYNLWLHFLSLRSPNSWIHSTLQTSRGQIQLYLNYYGQITERCIQSYRFFLLYTYRVYLIIVFRVVKYVLQSLHWFLRMFCICSSTVLYVTVTGREAQTNFTVDTCSNNNTGDFLHTQKIFIINEWKQPFLCVTKIDFVWRHVWLDREYNFIQLD